MKFISVFGAMIFSVLLISSAGNFTIGISAQNEKKPADVVMLGTEAKLGSVKFSHIDHTTKDLSIEGTKISCIECHHTAQPAAEAAKHPPLKTSWPADRTTTLTAELVDKDPNAAGAACRDCQHVLTQSRNCCPRFPRSSLRLALS